MKVLITLILITFASLLHAAPSQHYIQNLLHKYNIVCPEIVEAQFILESAHYKSKLANNNNNISGMKPAMVRPCSQERSNNKFAKYCSFEECIYDYYLWQQYMFKKVGYVPRNNVEYLKFLKKVGYATSKKYIKHIKHVSRTN